MRSSDASGHMWPDASPPVCSNCDLTNRHDGDTKPPRRGAAQGKQPGESSGARPAGVSPALPLWNVARDTRETGRRHLLSRVPGGRLAANASYGQGKITGRAREWVRVCGGGQSAPKEGCRNRIAMMASCAGRASPVRAFA